MSELINLSKAAAILEVSLQTLCAGLNAKGSKYKGFPAPVLKGRKVLYDKALVLEFKKGYIKGRTGKYTEQFHLRVSREQKAAIDANGGSKWI